MEVKLCHFCKKEITPEMGIHKSLDKGIIVSFCSQIHAMHHHRALSNLKKNG